MKVKDLIKSLQSIEDQDLPMLIETNDFFGYYKEAQEVDIDTYTLEDFKNNYPRVVGVKLSEY